MTGLFDGDSDCGSAFQGPKNGAWRSVEAGRLGRGGEKEKEKDKEEAQALDKQGSSNTEKLLKTTEDLKDSSLMRGETSMQNLAGSAPLESEGPDRRRSAVVDTAEGSKQLPDTRSPTPGDEKEWSSIVVVDTSALNATAAAAEIDAAAAETARIAASAPATAARTTTTADRRRNTSVRAKIEMFERSTRLSISSEEEKSKAISSAVDTTTTTEPAVAQPQCESGGGGEPQSEKVRSHERVISEATVANTPPQEERRSRRSRSNQHSAGGGTAAISIAVTTPTDPPMNDNGVSPSRGS